VGDLHPGNNAFALKKTLNFFGGFLKNDGTVFDGLLHEMLVWA